MKGEGKRAQELFLEALARPKQERAAFIVSACGTDTGLRGELEALLASAADGFPPQACREDLVEGATTLGLGEGHWEAPGVTIGSYELLQKLGEGGFGTVWLAQQHAPIRRRVALKVIKLGMDTREVIARFEAERQTLALLDHPGIAKVLDAGSTETGRPFFVMELVRGVPILEYCDTTRLTTRARLELFIKVCQAIQHAHQKGVIHRDLKPSNVLVTLQEGAPVPKVIDFGIAKATNQELTRHAFLTRHDQMIGSPLYMSPEQSAMTGLDIDTRSDIYSLGVLLYELLTGTIPFDIDELLTRGFADMIQALRETEPKRPSVHFAVPDPAATRAAARRGADARVLAQALKGDLDWVVMKCLEKDRTRRYETADALAADIRRHLDHQPVLAGPPSAAYRMRKFVRRNRAAVAAGTVIALALILGVVGTTWGLVRALGERDRTAQALVELEQVTAFQQSQLERINARAMGERMRADIRARHRSSLADSALDPAGTAAAAAVLEEGLARVNFTDVALKTLDENIFDRALAAIDEDFAHRPLIKARLLQAVAETLRSLGLLDRAMAPQAEALAIRRRLLGADHPATLHSMYQYGLVLRHKGRLGESEELLREVMGLRRRVLGAEHPETLRSIHQMGVLLRQAGRLDESEPLVREIVAARRRTLGSDHPDTLDSVNNLGYVLWEQGRYSEAEPLYREVLQARRRLLGPEHPSTLTSLLAMGAVLQRRGMLGDAEPFFNEALEKGRRILGNEHPVTLIAVHNMGSLLRDQGMFAAAEPLLRESTEKRLRSFGPEHPISLMSVGNLGDVLREDGRFAESLALLAAHEDSARQVLVGAQAYRLAEYLTYLGKARAALDRPGDRSAAEANLLEAWEVARSARGERHPDTLACIRALAGFYGSWHASDPSAGSEQRAAVWQARLDASEAAPAPPGTDLR